MSTTDAGWQLDEQGARDYEANLVAIFTDDWARDLLGRLGPRPGEAVLDVGTGTGIVARHAARLVGPGGAVDAVDVNPAMLRVAGELVGDGGAAVTFHEAPAEELPFDDGLFDVLTAQHVLQFADAPRALAEMRRVARPGARLGVATCRSLAHQPGYRVLARAIEHHLGIDAAAIIGSPYALGETDELVRLVTDAGFSDARSAITVTSTRFPSAGAFLQAEASSSPLGDITTRLDADVLVALTSQLESDLEPHTDSEGITFPFETVTVTAVVAPGV